MSHDVDSLRDDQLERPRDLIPGGRAGQRGPRCDNRRFVDALLWLARSGACWRDLPERFGNYQAVKRRYYRWVARDTLLGLIKTRTKLGVSFFRYISNRLHVPGAMLIPPLPDLVR